MREAFAARLAELERRIEDELERAAVLLADIADAIQAPSADKVQEIVDEAARVRQAGRGVDAELVIVTARQAPVASDLRLVLALIEVAHHSVLIANQFDLIGEQLTNFEPAAVDRSVTAAMLSAMTHLAGSQLLHAVSAFASRDLDRALRIDVEDDEIDKLNREVFEAAVALQDAPEQREPALRHVLVARSVERIADNAVSTSPSRPRSLSPDTGPSSQTHRCRADEPFKSPNRAVAPSRFRRQPDTSRDHASLKWFSPAHAYCQKRCDQAGLRDANRLPNGSDHPAQSERRPDARPDLTLDQQSPVAMPEVHDGQ